MQDSTVAKCNELKRSMQQNQKSAYSTRENHSLTVGSYIVSFDSQRHYQRLRHHWMVCNEAKPEELVLWGHASTRQMAEFAARSAIEKLHNQ